LARTRRVVLLGCFDAGATQEHRHAVGWHSLKEQFNRESIPESV